MPGPAVTVVVVLTSIAALFVFKEFVYEPHLAPKFEQWAEQYISRRRAQRRTKEGLIPVPIHVNLGKAKRSNGGTSKHSDDGSGDDDNDGKSSVELERLVLKDLDECRNQVEGGQYKSQLRHRKNVSGSGVALDESNVPIPYHPMSPTHASRDTPSLSSDTAHKPLSPLPSEMSMSSNSVHQVSLSDVLFTAQSPPGIVAPISPHSNHQLEELHNFEVLSASSRPDTPFSSFSSAVGIDASGSGLGANELRSPMSISDLEFLSASSDAGSDMESISEGLSRSDDEEHLETSWHGFGSQSTVING